MGIQDPVYPTLMEKAEQATATLSESDLSAAANTTQEGDHWIQLSSNLKYILITITTASAATVVRQHHLAMGLEVYKQLCLRFSTPLGTRSIGYLTKLLKPTFDHNNFWRVNQQLGIRATTLRSRQHHKTPRSSQDSCVDEWNKSHYNNTYISMHAHHQHTQQYEQQSWSTTEPQCLSQDCNNNHQLSAVTLVAEQHQWTLEQHTKAKARKGQRKE